MSFSDKNSAEKSVAIFGSTGSIGTQTLDVLATSSTNFHVEVLVAGSNQEEILKQAHTVNPSFVALSECKDPSYLKDRLPEGVEVLVGSEHFSELAEISDISVNGIVGFAGLGVTLGCLNAGKRLALANKESLIAGGPVVQKARRTPGAEIIPVDSEHGAIHQCLRSDIVGSPNVKKIQLTASGGPFLHEHDLQSVTLEQALNHPTWSMGPKITVDSSTLMNKGLEVIEAFELFGVPSGSELALDDIQVVVHPQSIVHSMVTYSDGSTISHLSNPDMRLPIAYALEYPDRSSQSFGAIDWSLPMDLSFLPPDTNRFRCLDLAYEASRIGKSAPAWLNAANEVAVDAFLNNKIGWIDISKVIENALLKFDGGNADSLDEVIFADAASRKISEKYLYDLKKEV